MNAKEAGFDAGYAKGYADGLDESAGDPRVERIEAGFKAMHEATGGDYSREDMIVMDALQAGRDFAVLLARREQRVHGVWGCNACGATGPWPSESGMHGGGCRGDVVELETR